MTSAEKLMPLPLLLRIREQLAEQGASVGLCHGCFDILHSGHVHHLQQAAAMVDVLVVSVTAAEFVNKGEGRPVFGDRSRLSVVSALSAVGFAVLTRQATAVGVIRQMRPDLYIKGSDYEDNGDPRLAAELSALAEVGGSYAVTDGKVWDSSSRAAVALRAGTVSQCV